MKRLILFELIILFLATTFESDSPPGWFQQVLPRNNVNVDDIFFIDSLNGWSTAHITPGFDTAFVFATTNGGANWIVQYQVPLAQLNALKMVDNNTGYIVGTTGSGKVWKTINNGLNWNIISNFSANPLTDLSFINKDTGWVCSDDLFDGGVYKTTNGGVNWQLQLSDTASPTKLFFINKDTGWIGTSHANGRLFRTINGGMNWSLQFTSIAPIGAIYFLNSSKGWIRGGTSGTNGVAYTTNSGVNWINGQGEIGGYDIKFMTDSIGYAGGGSQPLRIIKSKDGGKNWGYQTAQITPDVSVSILKNDTLKAWAGRQLLVHNTDGGGTITYLGIQQTSTEIPSEFILHQNYPNPFNPTTNIKYSVKSETSNVKLIIYDIQGRQIVLLVNQKQNAGTYLVDWSADGGALNYPSGVYFYSLIIDGITVDTKKMVLIK